MCGIAGYFNPDQNYAENPKQNFHTLSRMINTMNHRGPDTYGHTIINSCCLAHTRLSIIDLENGRQPMSYTKDGNTYYIVYNGEIYNYKEVKKTLLRKNYTFETNSDTEVIIAAFCHYGPGFVKELNGIFAIAIYDSMRNTLYLYRDRFGVKPLYYTKTGDTLVFASRIDTLFEYPRVRPCIDMNSFNEIFSLGPAKTYGKGVFSGIKEIKPGEYLTYSPQIISMTEDGDVYTVIVGYVPPTLAAVAGTGGISALPEKYMEYTISRWDGKDTLMSVRFSNYTPQTEEAGGEMS